MADLTSPYSPENLQRRKNAARTALDRGLQESNRMLTQNMLASGRGSGGGQLLDMQNQNARDAAQNWTSVSEGIDQDAAKTLFDRNYEEKWAERGEAERDRARAAEMALTREGWGVQSKEADEARAFATSEREGSQSFSERQSDINRMFSREERIGSEEYATKENFAEKEFRKQMAQKEYEYERALVDLRAKYAMEAAKAEAKNRKRALLGEVAGSGLSGIMQGWSSTWGSGGSGGSGS